MSIKQQTLRSKPWRQAQEDKPKELRCKSRRAVIYCCTLALLLAVRGAHAQQGSASHDSATIIALELTLSNLLERAAVDEYARHLTSDYLLTTTQGELLDREQSLTFWRVRGPGYKMIPHQMRVRIYGNTAVLTARVVGPKGGSGDRITKTFVRINGEWLLAALHASEIAKSGQ